MQRHDPFIILQCKCGARRDSFLANATEPFGNPSLSQQDQHLFFYHPRQQQALIEMDQLFLRQLFPFKLHTYSFSFFCSLYNTEVTMESRRLNRSAHQKPSTSNPLTNFAASNIIPALITKRKRPNVTIVSGNV